MVSKRRFFAVLLGLLFLAVCIAAVPAFATEDGGVVPYAQNGYDDPVYFPTPPAPPTPTPEPTPTPTPEPTPTPTPTPTPEPPVEVTPAPQNPNGGGYWENNYDDPTPTPTPTPTPRPGGITVTPTPSPSDGPTPATPPTVVRPVVTPKPSGTTDTSDDDPGDGTNYVTFAQLNMKNNSLAVTLFYGGLVLAVLGGAGLILLIVRLAKGRKDNGKFSVVLDVDETGNTAPRIPSNTPELVTGPGRTVRVDPSRPSMPAKSSTHQTHPSRPPFAGTDIHSTSQGFTPAESLPVQPPANAPIVPSAASYYTEEFSLEEGKKRKASASAPAQEQEPEEKKQPEQKTPPVPQESLASRLRAARARPPEQPDAPSRPPKPGNPAPLKKEKPASPEKTDAEETVQEPPENSALTENPGQPAEKALRENAEGSRQPEKPAQTEQSAPAEQPAVIEEPKKAPERQKAPKNTADPEDTPEQMTFQPQGGPPAETDEEPESKEKPDKPGKELPGQISFLE